MNNIKKSQTLELIPQRRNSPRSTKDESNVGQRATYLHFYIFNYIYLDDFFAQVPITQNLSYLTPIFYVLSKFIRILQLHNTFVRRMSCVVQVGLFNMFIQTSFFAPIRIELAK